LPYALAEYNACHDLELETYASGEAQVAALSDDIAYNNHDLQDGLRANLFTDDDIIALPVIGDCFAEVDALYPDLDSYRRRHEALRRVFGVMVSDVINESRRLIRAVEPKQVEDIRAASAPVVQFSAPLWADLKEIRSFLFARMYRAPSVIEMREKVTGVVQDLFPLFLAHPEQLPHHWRGDVEKAMDQQALARVVADYIAGMTDRFALQEWDRLVG